MTASCVSGHFYLEGLTQAQVARVFLGYEHARHFGRLRSPIFLSEENCAERNAQERAASRLALTPALSLWERGLKAKANLHTSTIELPLPLGEGWGEGQPRRRSHLGLRSETFSSGKKIGDRSRPKCLACSYPKKTRATCACGSPSR